MFKQFSTPHCHPMSFDSASTVEAFAKKEVEMGSGTLTCTDHGSLGGAYKTYELAKKNNLIPCVGCEIYMRDDNCDILSKNGVLKTSKVPRGSDKDKWAAEHPDGSFLEYSKYFHGTVGFQSYDAYLTCVKLLSKADDRAESHGSERKPIFDWASVEALAATGKVTMGSGCLGGMVGAHLAYANAEGPTRVDIARAYFERLHSLFGKNFYVEVFPHRCTHDFVKGVFIDVVDPATGNKDSFKYHFDKTLLTSLGEMKAQYFAGQFKKDTGIMLLGVKNRSKEELFDVPWTVVGVEKKEGFVQNECSPAAPNGDLQYGVNKFMMHMAKKHGVLCIVSDDSHFCSPSQKIVQDVRIGQGSGWKFYSSYHRQTSDEAFEYFKKEHGVSEAEFEGWIENSKAWADGNKDFKFDSTKQTPDLFYPKDTLSEVRRIVEKNGRLPKNDPRYTERLKTEIKLFHKNGTVDLLGYFLCCHEMVSLYERQGKLTGPARGSAGGVLLSYLLGITHVDPIKYGLSLDRFLTLDRIESGKLPDIDIDFLHRDLLCGFDCATIQFEAEDGTKHVLPKDFKIETSLGDMTAQEAMNSQADIKAWWAKREEDDATS